MRKGILLFMTLVLLGSCGDTEQNGMTLLKKGDYHIKRYENRKEIIVPDGRYYYYKFHDRVSVIRKEPGVTKIPYSELQEIPLYTGGPTRETEYEIFDDEQDKMVKKPRKPIEFREDVPKEDYVFLKKIIMENGPYIYLGEGIGEGRYLFILLNKDYYKEDTEELMKDERYYPARNRASRQVYLVDKSGAKSIELDLSELKINGLQPNTVISRIRKLDQRIYAVIVKEEKNDDKQLPYVYKTWLVEIRMPEAKAYPLFYDKEFMTGAYMSIGDRIRYLNPGREGEISFLYAGDSDNKYFVKVTDYYKKEK